MNKPKPPKKARPPVPIATDDQSSDADYDEPERAPLIDADQIATILKGKNAIKYFPWPADENITVAMRPLSREEVILGASAAKRYIQSMDLQDTAVAVVEGAEGGKGEVTWLDMCMRDEWLAIALRQAVNPELPLFRSSRDLRACLTNDEIDLLYEILNEHMEKVMPMTLAERLGRDEQWHALLAELKKKPTATFLAGLRPNILREFVYFLVAQLPSSPANKPGTSTS